MELTLTIALRKYCELIEKHGGRDKVVRICGYICTLISDLPVIFVIFKINKKTISFDCYSLFYRQLEMDH